MTDGRKTRAFAGAAVTLAVNVFISRYLFAAGFTNQLGSVEGAFIAISRYIMRHGHDLRWFPLWFGGMPLLKVYQPGLHVTVAWVALLARLSPERSYHVVTATLYCAGALTFYVLCLQATGNVAAALTSALLYSLTSPAALFSIAIRNDLGGVFLARRYQTLVHYGEGPHIAALALIPLAIVFLDRAMMRRNNVCAVGATFLLAVIAATNWTGSVGLALAVFAFLLACIGETGPKLRWLRFVAMVVLAYMLASPWIPPSIIVSVPGNAEASDGTTLGTPQLVEAVGIMAALSVIQILMLRAGTQRWTRFFVHFSLVSGALVLGWYWFGLRLLPQPHRWQLELEMALTGLLGCGLSKLRGQRIVAAGAIALTVFLTIQLFTYDRYARDQTLPIDIRTTIEYKEARWFEEHLPGQRVFAPGSIALWLNVLNETPQMIGCCDQSVPSIEHRIALYDVYVGDKQDPLDGADSILWLKAYGAHAAGVSYNNSREFFKSFANPDKFAGKLPVLWREGGDVIYGIPSRSSSLAHVIPRASLVSRAPFNGVDVTRIEPYVRALEDPGLPLASAAWMNEHTLHIEGSVERGQVISVQVTYSPNWNAEANGKPVPVRKDALGQLYVDELQEGPCRIDLTYNDSRESGWTSLACLSALLILAWWAVV